MASRRLLSSGALGPVTDAGVGLAASKEAEPPEAAARAAELAPGAPVLFVDADLESSAGNLGPLVDVVRRDVGESVLRDHADGQCHHGQFPPPVHEGRSSSSGRDSAVKLIMLGSGTSTGVPRIGEDWGECDPAEPKNRRLRCSMLVERFGPGGRTTVLIDTGPDLRQQLLAAEVKTLDAVVEETLAANNIDKSAIDWLIPHQANMRIITATAKRLAMPMERVVVTVDRHGNTSSASVPLALDEGVRSGQIKRGELLLLEAFGGGFTWGSALIRY